jgi:hypothetical protein
MKSYSNYFEKDGKYYCQNQVWWEKGGYFVPQTAKRITKAEYEKMIKAKAERSQSGEDDK